MEEVKEFKHLCKFCSKTFPCGRSLGGHMRSHLTNNSAETEKKLSKIKLSPFKNGKNHTNAAEMGLEPGTQTGYGLRENPKKTKRLADSSENKFSLSDNKFCRECGKEFQSWKALFGHMKCHSEKEKVSNSLEDQDSWTSAKLVTDSQSDNETTAPNRRRRSERRTRYMVTATSSSFSFANASSSVSEIEHEQEEVAMCLMMLSRDVGHWGGLNSSAAESSDNNSVYFESFQTNRINKIEGKISVCNGSKVVQVKKLSDKKLELGNLDSEDLQGRHSELCAPGNSRTRSMIRTEVSTDGIFKNDMIKKSQVDDHLVFEDSEVELGKEFSKETASDQAQLASIKCNSSKRKVRDSNDPELRSDPSKKLSTDDLGSEVSKNSRKRSKFECTTCNKIFHSYQALGGHRASHKKIKGCFATKIESSENSIEAELSPDPSADSKLIKSGDNENPIEQEIAAGYDGKTDTSIGSKKSNRHECPICLKVFQSGQALGGHKRSHMVAGSEARSNPTIVIQKPVPEIQDFLDLNLPAPVEEENNDHVGFTTWWVGSSHKHEALVGLISN
uniref:C2H2-type domain-containing protein n=1 Tax=Fagus sylvatica TaxID=28930 RepID=A0A2N9HIM6_FAGSY